MRPETFCVTAESDTLMMVSPAHFIRAMPDVLNNFYDNDGWVEKEDTMHNLCKSIGFLPVGTPKNRCA
jgi:hypothetical protein